MARPRVRPRTFVGYEAAIERHISPQIGRVRLAKLTPQHLQAWMTALETNGVSAGRRRHARVVLRTALNTAIRWRLITMNAATLIDAPRTTSREIRPLNPDEARVLLDACREHPLDAFVTVALGCGLRLGESLGLQWADVDLDAATLQVRRAVQRFGGDAAARRPLLARTETPPSGAEGDAANARGSRDARPADSRTTDGPNSVCEGQDQRSVHRIQVGVEPPGDRAAGGRDCGATDASGPRA